MTEITCQSCKKQVDRNIKFCPYCGTRINWLMSTHESQINESDYGKKYPKKRKWGIVILVTLMLIGIASIVFLQTKPKGFDFNSKEEVKRALIELEAANRRSDPINPPLKYRKLESLTAIRIGDRAPNFILPDVNGENVSLSSYLGPKILLIYFWAGWSGPCRKENPYLVAAYQKYHEKGFDIIGVSLDRTKSEWINAINNDKLNWTQVTDLKSWNSPVANLYGVKAIPASVLLNNRGQIVAYNLRGDNILAFVQKHLEE